MNLDVYIITILYSFVFLNMFIICNVVNRIINIMICLSVFKVHSSAMLYISSVQSKLTYLVLRYSMHF